MLINAELRFVSNGSQSFVPTQSAEPLHQRLVEMTNNDINAWSVFRPVASSATDIWDNHIEDFSNNENFPVHGLYSGYFQNISSTPQTQAINLAKVTSHTTQYQAQFQHRRKGSSHEQIYQEQESQSHSFGGDSPMLGNDYSQLSLRRGRGSFAEFSSMRNVLKTESCPNNDEYGNSTFAPVSSLGVLHTLHTADGPTLSTCHGMNEIDPGRHYGNYTPSSESIDSHLQGTALASSQHHGLPTETTRWPETDLREPPISFVYSGLPKCIAEQPASNLWNANVPIDNWSTQAPEKGTISPKALILSISLPSILGPASSQESLQSLSEHSATDSIRNATSDFLRLETSAAVEPQPRLHKERRALPRSVPVPNRTVPVLPSNDFSSRKISRKHGKKNVKAGSPLQMPSLPSVNTASVVRSSQRKAEAKPKRGSVLKHVESKVEDSVTAQDPAGTPPPSSTTQLAKATHRRGEKDDFLVRAKLAGMPYKEIRRQGQFTEAESTLRGRFRTLTKHKTARVRKPEWQDNDIRLLKKAVRKLTHGSDPSISKIPWKQVAEYIADNGGSYHFGNATCRKRWDELQVQSES